MTAPGAAFVDPDDATVSAQLGARPGDPGAMVARDDG